MNLDIEKTLDILGVKILHELQNDARISFLAIGLIFLCSLLIFGCQDKSVSNQFGTTIENRDHIAVASIFENLKDYVGKNVALRGVIDLQDERGYWFYLVDGDYRIYVGLYTANF